MTASTGHIPLSPSAVCPECGASCSALPSTTRSRIVAASRWIPWLGLLAAIGIVIGGATGAQQTARLGLHPRWSCPAGLTGADLAAIASGAQPGDRLTADSWWYRGQPWVLGPESIHVGWMSPAGIRHEVKAWGRPWFFVLRSRDEQYENAITQQGPTPRDWGIWRRSFWSGTVWQGAGPSGTQSPICQYWTGSIFGLVPLSILLIAAWYLGPPALGSLAALRRKPPQSRPRARLLAVGVTLSAFVAVALAFPSTSVSYTLGGTSPVPPSAPASPAIEVDSGWTAKDFLAAAGQPDGARLIARQLSAALPPPPDPSAAMAICSLPIPGRVASDLFAGWPLQWVVLDYEHSNPALDRGPSHFEVSWRYSTISYNLGGRGQLVDVTVRLDVLALYALATFALWKALRALSRLIEWRLIRRRRALGLCMACAYDLTGLRADPDR
jgi:hypothetical protein